MALQVLTQLLPTAAKNPGFLGFLPAARSALALA